MAGITILLEGTSGFSKKSATLLIPFLAEKIGDAKYKKLCAESLMSISEIVAPSLVVKGIAKQASDAKAPNIIIEN